MARPTQDPVELRVARLGAISEATRRAGALGFLALGSAADTGRLDRWSDLDFFVIAPPGAKAGMIGDLSWLSAAAPLAYAFRNTVDGYKALFEDGVFVEFAVFEPQELPGIPFAPGRLLWHDPSLDPGVTIPAPIPAPQRPDPGWLVGEALTNLLVGLGRWHRGERVSGFRFVQCHAVDRVIALASQGADQGDADPFSPERRVERRLPALAADLPAMMPGVDRCPAAARAILAWLCARHEVNPGLAAAILELCGEDR